MIDIYEVVKSWPIVVEFGVEWRVSPGVAWCEAGFKIRVGEGASVGARASVGEWASVGEGASVGARASVGEWASVGEGARVGARASVGEGASVGARASVGAWASVVADLGFHDGYNKTLCNLEGVAYIGAGCRWFTLADALKHWGNRKDRKQTLIVCNAAVQIAKLHKLRLK